MPVYKGLLAPQSPQPTGLLADPKQARVDAFLNGLGAMGSHLIAAGAPTTDPGGFGRNIAQAGSAFGQAHQNSMNDSRNTAIQNVHTKNMMQDAQMRKAAFERQQKGQVNKDRFANVMAMGGKDMAGNPVDVNAAMAQAYPELYTKAALEQQFATPGSQSAPVKNYTHRVKLVQQHGEGSPQVRQFDSYVRANKYLDMGDRYMQPNPANPTVPVAQYPKGIGPQREIVGGEVVTLPAVSSQPQARPQGTIPVSQGPTSATGEPESTLLPAEAEAKRKEAIAARRKITSQLQRLPSIRSTVQELKALSKGWSTGGFVGQMLQSSAGSDQYAMNAKVDEIKGLVGLDNLVSIKEQGGTFGALDRNELNLLIARAGTLDPLLESFPEDVDEVLKLYERGLAGQVEDFAARTPDEARVLHQGDVGAIIKTLGVGQKSGKGAPVPVAAQPSREELLQEIQRRGLPMPGAPNPAAAYQSRQGN